MIRELIIQNFALISKLHLEFEEGFTVFTGETGAGKSILIDAIGLALGNRASSESIRYGHSETEIIATFEIEKNIDPEFFTLLSQCNLNIDDSIIIRRTVSKTGKNRIFFNQIPIPLTTLKKIGQFLVDFHGQHDNQQLLYPNAANEIIQSLPEVKSTYKEYVTQYNSLLQSEKELESFDRQAQRQREKKEILEFQLEELQKLHLKPNEEHELIQEATMLSSITQRMQCIDEIIGNIEGTSSNIKILKSIATIRKNLETLSQYDKQGAEYLKDFDSIEIYFTELMQFCMAYQERSLTNTNPDYLNTLNERLSKIQHLKKKYSCNFPSLLLRIDSLEQELDKIDNYNADRQSIIDTIGKKRNQCMVIAQKLSKFKSQAIKTFNSAMTKEMRILGFTSGEWVTELKTSQNLTIHGLEESVFLVKTNPGEQFLPLTMIASGGEISRLLLAIKKICARSYNIPTLILDEIDTGIGGHIAKEVGSVLSDLSKQHQILSISHLHQIASLADNHFRLYKKVIDNRSETIIQKLSDEEQIEEISRMLGSDTQLGKKHAEEFMRNIKNKNN